MSLENYQSLSEEEKIKSNNMGIRDSKISVKLKNMCQLSMAKDTTKSEKIRID